MRFERCDQAVLPGSRTAAVYEREDGLQVTIVQMKGFCRRFFSLGIPFGSVHRRFFYGEEICRLPAGSAHFAEHLVFDNGEQGKMAQLFGLGADTNAYTTYAHTLFYFHASGCLQKAAGLFIDALLKSEVDSGRIEIERKIIEAELAMHRNDPDQKAYDLLMQNLYCTHALRDNIGGNEDEISLFNQDAFDLVRRAWYNGSRISVTMAGDFSAAESNELLSVIDSHIPPAADGGVLFERPENNLSGVRLLELSGDLEQPRFLIGIKGDVSGLPAAPLERAVFERHVELTLDSRLSPVTRHYDRLVTDGLIDESLFSQLISVPDAISFLIGGTSARPDEAVEQILSLVDLSGREGPDL
jgi:predicted Zn-dependent peptidase